MDGTQALVARHARAVPVPFQMVQELPHDRWGDVGNDHLVDGDAGTLACKWQEQCQRVAVARLRVAGKIAFTDQVLKEEAANPWTKQILVNHDGLRSPRTWRSADWLPEANPGSFADSAGSS